MKSPARLVLMAAMAAILVMNAAPVMAAQAFMKVQGANGPVNRDGEPGWFKAHSFTWGSLTSPARGGNPPRSGGGSLTFTKTQDSATLGLHKYCAEGRYIPEVKIIWYRTPSNSKKYIVRSVRITECPDPDLPGPETYSMDFGSIKWMFAGQKKDNKPDKSQPGK